jgi:hypothetical protein
MCKNPIYKKLANIELLLKIKKIQTTKSKQSHRGGKKNSSDLHNTTLFHWALKIIITSLYHFLWFLKILVNLPNLITHLIVSSLNITKEKKIQKHKIQSFHWL